jgi:2-amino-4-hydroxy-6-hydroxymethyldihydropteridine diphosphokinase
VFLKAEFSSDELLPHTANMRVYIALGSNLGSREEYLRSGVRSLRTRHVDVTRTASLYSTSPRDLIDQPWFLNTAIEAHTNLAPEELLSTCLEIERENHRLRDAASSKGPRTLDMDIIFYGSEIIRTPTLTVPHLRFSTRRFVLVPLAEIAPGFIDPGSGKTIMGLLQNCPGDGEVSRTGSL